MWRAGWRGRAGRQACRRGRGCARLTWRAGDGGSDSRRVDRLGDKAVRPGHRLAGRGSEGKGAALSIAVAVGVVPENLALGDGENPAPEAQLVNPGLGIAARFVAGEQEPIDGGVRRVIGGVNRRIAGVDCVVVDLQIEIVAVAPGDDEHPDSGHPRRAVVGANFANRVVAVAQPETNLVHRSVVVQ